MSKYASHQRENQSLFLSAIDAAKELVTIIPKVSNDSVIRKPVSKDLFIKAVKKALGKREKNDNSSMHR